MTGETRSMEEDMEVVYEGSELHKTLIEMGYTDFEYTPVSRVQYDKLQENSIFKNIFSFSKISHKIHWMYQQLMQETTLQQEQLQNILQMESLLDDHASIIRNSISKSENSSWKKILDWLPIFGTSFAAAVLILQKQKNIITLILPLSSTIYIYHKYIRWCAIKNLKTLVSLQNTLHNIIVKGLKILLHDFKMKLNLKKTGQKFIEFEKEKQKYLIPLVQAVTKSLEHLCSVYYRSCNITLSILPEAVRLKNLVTVFENCTFIVNGEITYSTLKNLYYTYILTQSEMLYLLAIAYSRDTWHDSGNIPELKLNHIISHLNKPLKEYCSMLLKIVNDYNACDIKPIQHKYKGLDSKWKDVYTQLNATSQKLRMSYLCIYAIMSDIDNYKYNEAYDEEFTQAIIVKMNEANKQIDSARSFGEFSALILARMQHVASKENDEDQEDESKEVLPSTSELPVILDSDPQILDEVFEEYIKEEYLKPLCEEDDEELLYNQKLSKLMATNFMTELKEVLIEKYKTMSERESKALQRMYRKVVAGTHVPDANNINTKLVIPVPPPMPVSNNATSQHCELLPPEDLTKLKTKLPIPTPRTKNEQLHEPANNIASKSLTPYQEKKPTRKFISQSNSPNEDDKNDVEITRFSINLCEKNSQIPSLFKVTEETFIGSGENSEDELCSDSAENNES